MLDIVLRDYDPEKGLLVTKGEALQVDLHDTCSSQGDYGAYGDLLKACYFVRRLGDVVQFKSHEYFPTSQRDPYRQEKWMVRLNGLVLQPQRLADELRVLRALVSEEDDPETERLWEEIQGLAADGLATAWRDPDCPTPSLFKAARLEQLLYWLQDDETSEEGKADLVEEIREMAPDLWDDPGFRSIVE